MYSSYRTYEEWKLISHAWNRIGLRSVLTVPMRNGNIFSVFAGVLKIWVLTVPMRNGNGIQSTTTTMEF